MALSTLTTLYVKTAADGGDNNNSGSSISPKVSASTGVTSAGDNTILVGDIRTLGVLAGDTIRLNGETGGLNGSDIFEIVSIANEESGEMEVNPAPVNTAAPIAYVIGGAWASPDRAMNVLGKNVTASLSASGVKVYVKGGTYAGPLTILREADGPTLAIDFEAWTIAPGDLSYTWNPAAVDMPNSQCPVIIDGATAARSLICSQTNKDLFFIFRGFDFYRSNGAGVDFTSTTRSCIFDRCRARNNAGHGFSLTATRHQLIMCESKLNAVYGYLGGTYSGAHWCRFHDNTNHQVLASGHLEFCVAYRGAGGNWSIFANNTVGSGECSFVNCVADGDGGNATIGFNFASATGQLAKMINCIAYDCNKGAASVAEFDMAIVRNNLFSKNATADRENLPAGYGDVDLGIVEPGFVDAPNHDYRIRIGSPAWRTGLNFSNIGADQRSLVLSRGEE